MSFPVSLLKKVPGLSYAAKTLYAAGGFRLHNLLPFALPERRGTGNKIFVDVSAISDFDNRTGIQRVTRNMHRQLARSAQSPSQVAPVYARMSQKGYFAASPNTAVSGPPFIRQGTAISVRRGDVFIGLDFVPMGVLAQFSTLAAMKRHGVRLLFFANDLLPVQHPEWFPAGTAAIHAAWLKTAASLGELVCISRTVRDEALAWLKTHGIHGRETDIHWLHLGADPDDFAGIHAAATLPPQPCFLVVSTVEPRKGHWQTLRAFELLWQAGKKISLVFAGKKGWKVEALCRQIVSHEEFGRRLYWYDNAPDSLLGELYRNATCVLSPSLAEGFGLSLVEAASFGKPLLLRDLPVYREVAGAGATYFSGSGPEDLAACVVNWLKAHAAGKTPATDGMSRMSWEKSCSRLWEILAGRPAFQGK